MRVNGENLGNWLVLEKWMNPAIFTGTDAEDETYLVEKLDPKTYEARIKLHRAEYITERDFLRISSMGFNTVRIPIPFYIFGDRKPFIGCIEELEKTFSWAENHNLKILIDLHTAPESQNGFDNGGLCGRIFYREIAKAQLDVWEKGEGHFYWNYKLLIDCVNSGWYSL